jgi:uncharacterized membrane protein YtjA (UPF0391 family)
MQLAGLVLLVIAAGVSILDFLGITPGAAGVVSLLLVVATVLMLGGGIQAAFRGHQLRLRHSHAHR